MTDGDGVGRPVSLASRSAGDEAEIDESDLGAIEVSDNIGPHAGMEAPTMDEHEMHRIRFTSPAPGAAHAPRRGHPQSRSMSDFDRAAVTAKSSRAVGWERWAA